PDRARTSTPPSDITPAQWVSGVLPDVHDVPFPAESPPNASRRKQGPGAGSRTGRVGRAGFEPATRGLKAPCSDQTELPPPPRVYGGNHAPSVLVQDPTTTKEDPHEGQSEVGCRGAGSRPGRGDRDPVARPDLAAPHAEHLRPYGDGERHRDHPVGARRGGGLARCADAGADRATGAAGEREQDDRRHEGPPGRRSQAER